MLYNHSMKILGLKDRIIDLLGTIADLIIMGIGLGFILTIALLVAGALLVWLIDSGYLG